MAIVKIHCQFTEKQLLYVMRIEDVIFKNKERIFYNKIIVSNQSLKDDVAFIKSQLKLSNDKWIWC